MVKKQYIKANPEKIIGYKPCGCCGSEIPIYEPLKGKELEEWKRKERLARRRELYAKRQWQKHRKKGMITVKRKGNYINVSQNVGTDKKGQVICVGGIVPSYSDIYEFQV